MAVRRVTLEKIARDAQVSIATVSQALNGKGRISDQKRNDIKSRLRRAGYRPKSLRQPIFYLRSLPFASLHDNVQFIDTHSGLTEILHAAGYDMHVDFLPTSGPEKNDLDNLMTHKPGGVILDSNLKFHTDMIFRFFERQDVACVQVGHVQRVAGCDAVVVDNFNGARAAVSHLAERHRRIATIRWQVEGDPASAEKYAGFQCALGENSISICPEYVVESPAKRTVNELPGLVAIKKLLDLPEPPTAVFVENSFVSAPLLYPAIPGDLELPAAIRELDIVHFEALYLDVLEEVMSGALMYPNRQAKFMRIDWKELGRVAAKRMLERLDGAENSAQILRIAPKLVAVAGMTVTAV